MEDLLWAMLVPGFHEASSRHMLPCTLVGVLVDEAIWPGLLASKLVGAEPSITALVEDGNIAYNTQLQASKLVDQ
jgi:hypothetical protein